MEGDPAAGRGASGGMPARIVASQLRHRQVGGQLPQVGGGVRVVDLPQPGVELGEVEVALSQCLPEEIGGGLAVAIAGPRRQRCCHASSLILSMTS
jgi:hypothetical protein